MKINLQCPINQLGYGVTSLNILKALQSSGVEVSLFTIGQPQVTNQRDAEAVKLALETSKNFDYKSPCIKIWHQNQMAERIGSGKFIGFPIFELDTFSDLEKRHLQSCDELMVCSQWAKNIILDQVPKLKGGTAWSDILTNVVPLGVDTELFPPAPARQGDKTIFFNCGKWEIRKGHDILIEAFKKVVEQHDNVELWMMCSNPFNSKEENARWHQLYNHPKVKIIPRAETQSEVYNIMKQVDCGVFPSRAEGWNLELLEMMSVGKHVITTNYSAHTEFCTNKNSSLVDIISLESAFDGKWFFGQGNWAKINSFEITSIVKKMIDFHVKNQENAKLNEAGIETARKFSWENTAKEIIKCLQS